MPRPLGSAEKLEERRREAVRSVLAEEVSISEAAHRAKVSRRSVFRWLAAHRDEGSSGLEARPSPGRPALLDEKDLRKLERLLLKGAKAAGFSDDLWTCPRVAKLIRDTFDVEYHVGHVWKLLAKIGWSPQRPVKKAAERDEAAIERWKKVEWPRLKKPRHAQMPP